MERTQEELEKLLVGRWLNIVRKVPGDVESKTFAVSEVSSYDDFIVLRSLCNDAVSIDTEDIAKFLAGDGIVYYSEHSDVRVSLLPVEEPAEQSKPTKPALTHDWQKRWWQFYYHFITADETSAEEAASMADEAITVARKHLEGE